VQQPRIDERRPLLYSEEQSAGVESTNGVWAGLIWLYRVGKKWGHRLVTTILSILNRFNKFFTGRFPGKFAVKWMSKVPPHLAYVATLPCETLISAKQAINDKLHGSVATYFWGVVGLSIPKLKTVYCSDCEWKKLKSVNIWRVRALSRSFSSVLAKRTSARDNHVLACNFAKCSPIFNHSQTQQ